MLRSKEIYKVLFDSKVSKVTNILKAVRGQLISKGHLPSPILSKTNENST